MNITYSKSIRITISYSNLDYNEKMILTKFVGKIQKACNTQSGSINTEIQEGTSHVPIEIFITDPSCLEKLFRS